MGLGVVRAESQFSGRLLIGVDVAAIRVTEAVTAYRKWHIKAQ